MSAAAGRRERDVVTWAGCVVVGGAAAVMSFTALADLARLMGVTAAVEVFGWTFHVAWLLPVTIDILAAVATRVWLRRLGGWEAVRFAQRAAWGAIAATVGGNAYHGYLTGHGEIDVVVVAAVPAVVFGTIVHLGMLIGSSEPLPATRARERWWWRARAWMGGLLGRAETAAPSRRRRPAPESLWEATPTEEVAGPPADTSDVSPAAGLHLAPSPAPGDEPGDVGDPVAELVATGAGWRKVQEATGLSEYHAKKAIRTHRNGSG